MIGSSNHLTVQHLRGVVSWPETLNLMVLSFSLTQYHKAMAAPYSLQTWQLVCLLLISWYNSTKLPCLLMPGYLGSWTASSPVDSKGF